MQHKDIAATAAVYHFANTLKALRKSHGLSQTKLADALDVSRGSISYYENMERIPDIAFLVLVQRYFKLSFEELLGSYEDMVDILYNHLQQQLEERPTEHYLRFLGSMSRRLRQRAAKTHRHYQIIVLRRYVLNSSKSVVLHIERLLDYDIFQMSYPLTEKEYAKLLALGYVPKIRSKAPIYAELYEEPDYARVAIKRSRGCEPEDIFDTLHVLKRELEQMIAIANNSQITTPTGGEP